MKTVGHCEHGAHSDPQLGGIPLSNLSNEWGGVEVNISANVNDRSKEAKRGIIVDRNKIIN